MFVLAIWTSKSRFKGIGVPLTCSYSAVRILVSAPTSCIVDPSCVVRTTSRRNSVFMLHSLAAVFFVATMWAAPPCSDRVELLFAVRTVHYSSYVADDVGVSHTVMDFKVTLPCKLLSPKPYRNSRKHQRAMFSAVGTNGKMMIFHP